MTHANSDDLIETLQGIILAQTKTLAMVFKVLVDAEIMDGRSVIDRMRDGPHDNDTADGILQGQAQALENWMNNREADPAPVFRVIDGGKQD